jgi:hypothetical protein
MTMQTGDFLDSTAALESLRLRFPWPTDRPAVQRIEWSLDFGGRHLIADAIRNRRMRLVLEVGAFLGGSVRTWLEASPSVTIIAVDTWNWLPHFDALCPNGSSAILAQLKKPDGFYHTFLTNLWPFKERVIPIRSRSPEIMHELVNLGVLPDLIYLDADKTGHELELGREYFPKALLGGDDWWYGRERGYPIRAAVQDYCKRHGAWIRRVKHTWILEHRTRDWASLGRELLDRTSDLVWHVRQMVRPKANNPMFLTRSHA